MDQVNIPVPINIGLILSTRESQYIDKVQSTISECARDLSQVSEIATEIKSQGGWDNFWKKGENIKLLADNLGIAASVQQRTLDTVILLMGAAGYMKKDYNIIIQSIDELSKSHSGNVEVLDYLVKIKNTVESIKQRDKLLESLITYTNDLRDSMASMESNISVAISDLAKKDSTIAQQQGEQRLLITELLKERDKFKIELTTKFDSLQIQQTTLTEKDSALIQQQDEQRLLITELLKERDRFKIELTTKFDSLQTQLIGQMDNISESTSKRFRITWFLLLLTFLIALVAVVTRTF